MNRWMAFAVFLSMSCGGPVSTLRGPSTPSPTSPSSTIEVLTLDIRAPSELWIGEVNYATAWGELSYPMYEQIGAGFESLNPDIVSATSQGQITGLAPGVATLRAVFKKPSGDLTATRKVTVLPITVGPPTALTLFPSSDRFWAVGQRVQLKASVDQPGRPATVPVTAGWRSSNPSVATVSSDGLLTVHTFGQTQVRATYLTLSADLAIDVMQPTSIVISTATSTSTWSVGREDHFLATARVPGRQYGEGVTEFSTWSSSNPSVVALDAKPGDVWPAGRALRAGTAIITANYAGIVASLPITVID
jgi:hypothetical protein